jgi:hypothetical protein
MLLAFLTGCSNFNKTGEGGNESNNNEPGNGGNEAGDVETDNSNNQNNEENQKPKGEGTPLDKDSDVIESIIDYLYNYYSDHDMGDNSLKYKIRLTVNGVWRPIEVTFNTFDYYFVCGYDNDPNNNHFYDSRARKCNWYKFNSADAIPEFYGGEKCAYVFQFNKASSIVNLLEGQSDVPKMEHFLWYQPEFEDGYNAKPPIAYGETIIYLCYTDYLDYMSFSWLKIWDEGTIYYSTSSYDYRWVTIPTVDIDGVKYVYWLSKEVGYESNGQDVNELPPDYSLGKYYNDFIDVIEVDKYSVERVDPYHEIDYYSCILVKDFFKILNEEILN